MPRALLIASAVFMALLGLALTFAPSEFIGFVGSAADGWALVMLQICGALYFGFALLNWSARGTLIGGIYGRPIVIGNLVHFVIGTLALVKAPVGHGIDLVLWALTLVYAVFAVLFTVVLFRSPSGMQNAG
jgi:hypothetical protein